MTTDQKLYPTSMWHAPDFESFKQQESTFVLLNMFLLVGLLLIHAIFASYWGDPSRSLIVLLAAAILAQGSELVWLTTRTRPLDTEGIARLSWASIGFNIILALLLAIVSNRPDTQYFIVLAVPVLVAAFRLALLPTIAVIAVVDAINFFWVWSYARHLEQAPMGEYFEAMTVSLIYVVVGVLVWLLLNNLRRKEMMLTETTSDLQKARERVVQEEKLAAVGRLASAIAHEIRNPVGAIVSALSTAKQNELEVVEREEMFQIASKEATRLARLTTEFLTYARPRGPQKTACSVDDLLGYVADVCRPRAAEKQVSLHNETSSGLTADMDPGQMQQALVNMVMNAVEASPPGSHVNLHAAAEDGSGVRIEVTDEGDAIPSDVAIRIFEPFFTTKQAGTGLGLAIAHSIATAHGGDLALSANEPGRVSFCLTLPETAPSTINESAEAKWAES